MRKAMLTAIALYIGAPALADEIVLTNEGADTPIALVDADIGSCENDAAFESVSPIDIGDASQTVDCDSEIVVFSDDNAIAIVENPGLTAGDDSVSVSLVDRWTVPVRYWVATINTVPDATKPALEAIFGDQIDLADQAFNESHAGLTFEDPTIAYEADATWGAEVVELAEEVFTGADPDAYLAKLAERITPVDNTINIYAIESTVLTGFHISQPDGQSSGHITIGVAATMSTPAHEIGHAMSLDHINFIGSDPVTGVAGEYCVAYGHFAYLDGTCDYSETNLMWAGQSGPRDEITEGQSFRTTVNTKSYINGRSPPIRPIAEPRRDCPDWTFGRECPYVALDE